jgi:hypothetical protein
MRALSLNRFSAPAAAFLWAVGAFSFFALSNAPAHAVQPQLTVVTPVGLQRGVETEWKLQGARLADAKEILFYTPGFTVGEWTVEADNAVKAKVTVAPDCPLGIHALRVRSESGLSNLITFTVGPFPQVEEKEPNSDFSAPQPIEMNTTVTGVVQAEDVDYYVVEAKKGQRISAEVEGLRLGYDFFDPYLAILNTARFELARSDDASLLNQDCLVSLVAPEDGKYIVQLRESAFGGSGASRYRIHIGTFPRPTAIYPAGGKPGEALNVRYIGDAAGDLAAQVTLPAAGKEEFGAHAQDAGGISPSPNLMRVIDLPNALEVEPNDALAQASPAAAAPLALNGIIEKQGDVDFFKFTATKGQQLDVRVYARKTIRSSLDSVIQILNAQGGGIASNDDSGGPDSYLRFAVPADGEYHLVVRDHLNAGGPSYVYRVEITQVAPALTMVVPERQQYIPTTLTIPKGNRMAMLVGAQRANFGGVLNVNLEGLPAGVTVETLPMAADRTDIPVLFTAAADAAPAGAMVDVVGKPADANVAVVGHLNQRAMLVRGQNNVDVWGHDANRLATVVSDEIPFKIDIVPPKAPLVRNGSLNLKVVATRAEDFTAPINIQMLYNPPGVASSGSIVIPEGQNEAVIPLTGNAQAALGTWKIVVLAQAAENQQPEQANRRRRRGAGFECSSQFADLVVADQFYKFQFERAAVEQGKETELSVKVEKTTDFEGEATAELLGIPAGVTTEPVKFTKDSTELVFKIKTAADAREGKHGGLVCRTTFNVGGEPVVHTLGSTELRVDKPLPPKVDAPPPMAAPMPQATPAPMPEQKKRLSRLEQLRLEKEQQK